MALASDVIAILRPLLNDNESPYRYADTSFLKWLSDGQRLIAQLKPEANPVTELFTPVTGTPRQRLDASKAYGLVRVEYNHCTTTVPIPDPAFTFDPVRHFPEAPLSEGQFLTIINQVVSSFPFTTGGGLPPGWTAVEYPTLVLSFSVEDTGASPADITGVTHGGRAMTVWTRRKSFVGDDLVQKHITLGLAILALNPADPPPTSSVVVSGGPGGVTFMNMQLGVFSNVNVPATIANLNTIPEATQAANGHYVDVPSFAVANGDILLLNMFLDWTNVLALDPTIRYPEVWNPVLYPTYTSGYDFFSVTSAAAGTDVTVGGNTRQPYGLTVFRYIQTPQTTYSARWWYAYTNISQFPSGEQAALLGDYPDAIGASFLPAYIAPVRLYALQGATIDVVTEIPGTAIRSADQDVYDTFDEGWMARTPDPAPAAGQYFDGFCFDRDDPLGFLLHPKPAAIATRADKVAVTYIGIPPELTAVGNTLTLSDMYVDPLVNYAMYRALSSQTQGYSAVGASRAVERFGEQLNLSRETIQALMGEPHRKAEQES